MTDSDDRMTDRELDAETAFALLADETRVRILEELGAATASPETGIPRLSYADLQSRVGVRDSGRFNYHLTKLRGVYVAKEGDGYRLRWPGMILYRTLVAGLFTDEADPSVAPFPAGTDCHRCGHPLEAGPYESLFRIGCPSCDAIYADVPVPPHGLTDRSRAEILEAVHRHERTILGAMTAGQCSWCASEVAVEVRAGDGPLPSRRDARDLEAYAVYHCTDCTGFQYVPISQALCYDPVAVAFYHERGRDLTAIPSWTLPWAVTGETTTVLETDPWRFSVAVPLEDERLVVELDDELTATDSRRQPARGE